MLNKVMIIGNLWEEPEMRFTPQGKAVTNFSVAVNKKRGENENTEWFNIVAWNNLAESCNRYLNKGSKVYVEGELQTRSWENNDGQKHYKTEVIANQVEFLDRKQQDMGQSSIEPEDPPF